MGHVTEGECQWQLLGAQHGSEVRVHVTCVNTVQLHTTTTSLPVTVLLRPPDVTQVLAFKKKKKKKHQGMLSGLIDLNYFPFFPCLFPFLMTRKCTKTVKIKLKQNSVKH